MSSYRVRVRRRRQFIDDMVAYSQGLDETLVEKILIYAESLLEPGLDEILETTYINQMSEQFNLNNSYMISLIYSAIRSKRASKGITLHEFIKLVCTFMTPNLDMRINFVFSVYDTDKDGFLSRAEIYKMLKPSIVQDEEEEEMVKDLIELVVRVVDAENRGLVDLDVFRSLVKKMYCTLNYLDNVFLMKWISRDSRTKSLTRHKFKSNKCFKLNCPYPLQEA